MDVLLDGIAWLVIGAFGLLFVLAVAGMAWQGWCWWRETRWSEMAFQATYMVAAFAVVLALFWAMVRVMPKSPDPLTPAPAGGSKR